MNNCYLSTQVGRLFTILMDIWQQRLDFLLFCKETCFEVYAHRPIVFRSAVFPRGTSRRVNPHLSDIFSFVRKKSSSRSKILVFYQVSTQTIVGCFAYLLTWFTKWDGERGTKLYSVTISSLKLAKSLCFNTEGFYTLLFQIVSVSF